MSWLATLIAEIAEILISRLGGDILVYLKGKEAKSQAQKAAVDSAKASVLPLQIATTGAEIDKATDEALDNV